MKRIIAALIVALIFLTTGCVKEEMPEPVEITLMHGWGGTLQTHKTMQEIYADFSKKNPDIILKCVSFSDNNIAVRKANDMLAVGRTPDILSTNGLSYYMRNVVKCEQAMDLMPYIKADAKWKAQIHSAVFSTWQTSGEKLYTIPDALEVSGYWYNLEYMKQAGIVDETGAVKIPKTWQEFIKMSEQLQQWIDKTGKNISVFSLDNIQMTEFLFLARLAGENENGMMAAINPSVKINDEVFGNTMRDLATLKQYSDDVDSIENARQRFSDGKSIVYFNGVWESDVLKESRCAKEMAYAAYPTNEGKGLSYVSASSGYILAKQQDERKAEACIRFLKYMLCEEVQMKIAVKTGQAPSNPNIDMEEVRKQLPLFGAAIYTAYNAPVQISMIQTLWTEEKIEIINTLIGQENWLTDGNNEYKKTLEKLNHS